MSNLTKLKAIKERYGVGNMEIADLATEYNPEGFSYETVFSWSVGRRNLSTNSLREIGRVLALKYPSK